MPIDFVTDPAQDAPGHFLGIFPVPDSLSGLTSAYSITVDDEGYVLYWRQPDEHLYKELSIGATGADLARVLAVITDWREVLPALEAVDGPLAASFKQACEAAS